MLMTPYISGASSRVRTRLLARRTACAAMCPPSAQPAVPTKRAFSEGIGLDGAVGVTATMIRTDTAAVRLDLPHAPVAPHPPGTTRPCPAAADRISFPR